MTGRGVAWEALAGEHLQRAGLRVLARNFRTRFGEIDLICRDGDVLVFVEVRYRARTSGYGSGADSVTAAKRQRLIIAAGQYRQAHPALTELPCRFDVVAITGQANAPLIDWRQRAFDAA